MLAWPSNEATLLQGIVEVDETCVGGKPRQENRRGDDPGGGAPRGCATRKTAVPGALQRGGKVVTRVARDWSSKGILCFFRDAVSPESLLKRAWYGSHHYYSKHWLPLFVAEAKWKYNHRHDEDPFSVFLAGCFPWAS